MNNQQKVIYSRPREKMHEWPTQFQAFWSEVENQQTLVNGMVLTHTVHQSYSELWAARYC